MGHRVWRRLEWCAVDGVERLKALMSRCLHAEPSRRPSMDAFLAELDAIRDPSSLRASDSGYDGATRPSPAADRTVTPRDTVVTPGPVGATPPPAVTAQLFDMSHASEELAALEVPADVRNRVCAAMG
jgi:hypothetical protein